MIFYLLNKGQQTVKILNNNETVESNLDETINAASELKFSVPLQKRLDSNIYYVLIPTGSGNDFYMFKIISEDIQKDRVEYSAVESAYDELKSYSYIKDIRPNQVNAAQMLQQVLKNTRWSLGYVEDTGIQSSTFYYITVLEAIQKIVDLFKVELTFTIQLDPVTQQITGRKVNLYQQQGRRTGKRFEYGSNLITVTREENSQNLVTALVGRGKGIQVSGQNTEDTTDDGYGRRLTFADVEWKTTAGAPVNKPKGQEYVEDPKATALYGFSDGRPRIGLVTFEDIEDPNQLLNATWSALLDAKRPKVSFKAEVTDVGDLQLGDTIAIIRHDLGIEYFTRVYKVHHDLKDKNKNTVEMGDDFSSRSITSAISTAIQTSQDATEIANAAATSANGKNRNFYSDTKPNFANEGDNLYLDLGNGETELWVWHHGQWEFVQSTVELHTVQKQVQETQSGLNDAKKQIADNLSKADKDIAELNANIREQKKAFDTDIDELNASIRDQKGTIDGLSTTINTVAIPKITDVTNKVSDALTKINEQKNIVTELQNQASQQGKDISKITTDVHGVTADLANLNGDVNQTKATVQGLQSTLGNAQGDIAQIKVDAKKLETSLSGKVDNSTYATFVNQTNQALNAKLVASDLNGYAKTTDLQATANGLRVDLNSVTDRMNNLKVGGRNLVAGTEQEYTMGFGIPNTTWKDGFAYGILPTTGTGNEILPQDPHMFWYTLTAGQEYTQTIWFKTDATVKDLNAASITWYTANLHDYQPATIQKIGPNSYKLFCSYKWPGKNNNDVRLFDISELRSAFNLGTGTYLKFGKLKLEVGNTSTDWVPAIEDTEHSLTELSARITANSQQFGSYYTKVEADNKTNSAKEEAKNSAVNAIKGDANWQGLSNIITNSGFLQSADGFIQKVQQTTQPIINANNGGGINLFTGTKDYSDWHLFNHGAFEDTTELPDDRIKTKIVHVYGGAGKDNFLMYNKPINVQAGEYYTLSFLCRYYQQPDVAEKVVNYPINFFSDYTDHFTGGSSLIQIHQVSNKWVQYSATFKIEHSGTYDGWRIISYIDKDFPGGSLYFANIKLERGRVVTPWTPAPDDMATQIAFTQLSQTIKGLQSTVSGNYENLQSQISQTAGTISTVVGKVNNLEIATNVQIVDHGIDLNTYKSTGTWFVKGAGTNAPASNWFYLDVKTAWDGRIVQIWQSDNVPTDRYVRTYTDDHWSNWERSASYSEYSTLNQTVKGLQSTVSNNYTNLQSQLSQTAGTISTVVGKVNNLEIATNVQIVDHGIDLNTYKSTGTWFVKGAGTNAPESTWFYLEVKTAWDGRVIQTWQRDNLPTDRYVRTYTDGYWSNWERSASYSEYSTLNQTVKGLQSTVSNNYTNLQSQISQTAGTIRSEVTNKTNNLQSQITQNANNINIKVNAVGDLSNICLNPSFIDGSTEGWENVFSSSGDLGSPTKFYGGVNTRNAFYGNMFAVAAGDKYFFSVFAWQNQSTHPLNIGFTYLQKDGTWNWQSAINFAPNEGMRTKSGSITIPKEAVKARIWVEIDSYSDFGNWWFTNLIVRKNDTISQINMSAGTTLIQNDKIYMDASSTVFSGKAFIPDAAITNISADKINTGTLDAGRINVINLNANNITTGTINGANLKIDLNSGEILFQKGRIASTNGSLNIDLDNGRMSVTNWMNQGVYFENGNMVFDDQAPWLTSNNDPKYGGIKRADWSTFAGSDGLEIYAQNGIVLKSQNFDGALDNGSFLDNATMGAAFGLNKDGEVLLKSTKYITLTGGNRFDLSNSGKYPMFNSYPSISIGTGAFGGNDTVKKGSRITIEASYLHVPSAYVRTTGSAPNVYVAPDGALVRSTSASKYKTEIKRSYSTEYGEKLLNLPTAIWTDKGQKERYEAGKRHIKPEKYFGMIAEDLADAGLDLLVSRNPLTHEIEGIQYERIAPALLPVIKKLKDKVNELEKQINE